MLFSFLLIAVQAPAAPSLTSEATHQTMGAAVGQLLQGNGKEARSLFGQASEKPLAPKDLEFVQCALKRLGTPPEAPVLTSPLTHQPDPFASAVLGTYQSYWQKSIADPGARHQAEQDLASKLAVLLDRPATSSVADLEPALSSALEARGFHSLEGQTGLFHELMLWTKQTRRIERVKLPEVTNSTPTYYLDDFVSQGWSSYFTCNRTGTGGWTNEKGLFVVVPGYKSLTDENFRVNFLAHESQHFADNLRFPGLKPWELEYRAKLVELSLAVTTSADIIQRFRDSEGDNPDDQHSYANKQVIGTLRHRLKLNADDELASVPVARIQQAALASLRADSARRSRTTIAKPKSQKR